LPPVIGWTAATGTLDVAAVVLFLIVFFWQVPHFLAIRDSESPRATL
jgi:protoheme IX farnesyltransferase